MSSSCCQRQGPASPLGRFLSEWLAHVQLTVQTACWDRCSSVGLARDAVALHLRQDPNAQWWQKSETQFISHSTVQKKDNFHLHQKCFTWFATWTSTNLKWKVLNSHSVLSCWTFKVFSCFLFSIQFLLHLKVNKLYNTIYSFKRQDFLQFLPSIF